ncbi:RNA polymerase sigma-70 factor, ECF subfamily [Pedobacter steynii]|uniref:RNA polymerase sigma-70 factor, ECF subfamily n=1 Tax=Pedobacter steynii TaxID=430522 RepID=A0A1G9L3Z7_9SPHI|nr:sigma-70 family RNA polymerase sigma factor [Pedobacter steynii]NQX38732.1 sigma-70 family RNA polymerase sigma factor [Pedobacter steynii]SDL56728.1 RNA polymerase sigma-70 factor, ECF subfamily [Pedobacter steynii]
MTKVKIIESDLIRAVADGNEKAFEVLYTLYYQKLHKFLLKTVQGQEESTLDILQEAFLRVWLNRDRLMEIENFQAWIYKVVSTEALTQIRKELHIKTKADRLKSSLETDAQTLTPKHLEIAEIKAIVNQAVRGLPHQRRTIYLLSREEGLSPLEIAIKLNISINTVYNTLTVALKSIRQDLSKSGYGIHLSILLILELL